MRVLVCGGRDFDDYKLMCDILSQWPIKLLISGHAKGADRLAERWAIEEGIVKLVYPPLWQKYGKAAGPIRNQQMLDEGKPDLVIAFPGGRGTTDMVNRARDAKVAVYDVSQRQEIRQGL